MARFGKKRADWHRYLKIGLTTRKSERIIGIYGRKPKSSVTLKNSWIAKAITRCLV